MKRILFILFLIPVSLISYGATITWDGGGGDGLWATATNWAGDIIPGPADDAILDNSVVGITYTVTLPVGAASVTISSLAITPTGLNNITLILPLTNTSATAFIANGAGDAIVLNSGAIFINSSGAATGTPVSVTNTNFFRINNGGRYVHKTPRGHTDFLVSRLSIAPGTEKGIFEFDVPGAAYTISLSGRTYGNLKLSSANHGGPVTYSGTGANPLNINSDLQISSGVTFSIAMTANCIVHGNYNQALNSQFNIQSLTTGTGNNSVKLMGHVMVQGTITESGNRLPVLELNGTANQNISVTGSITNSINFRINNSSGVTLLTPVTLPYNLDLQNGKIKTDATNILTLIDNATVTGGASASFVEGPMKKIGDDETFSFPVGKGNIYAPINFYSPGMSVTDAFQAEYFRLNPQTTYGVNYEIPTLHHISYVEYWKLEKISGSTAIPANVTLTVTQYSFAKDINLTYVARYNAPDLQWKNSGIASRSLGAALPPYITGSITSSPVTEFGVFTLASSVPEAINPLPVNLISFDAFKMNANKVKITWELAGNYSGDLKLEIERSENGNEFIIFKTLFGNSSDRFYTDYDDRFLNGVIRYRLKITNAEGQITYSNIVSLVDDIKGWSVSLFPNPVSQNAVIKINASNTSNLRFLIYDLWGKTIRQWSQSAITGTYQSSLQTSEMKTGIYFVSVSDGKTKVVIRFIKL